MTKQRAQASKSKNGSASLGEFVYQHLQAAIREGRFHPGERIREADVSTELDVSRTPVREALRRLQSEGRVTIEPQRGAIVAELDHQEVTELYALREHLEGIAARFAAQHAAEPEVLAMEYILEKSLAAETSPRELNQINWDLHHAIYNAAHNRFLTRAIGAISDSMALLRGVKYIPKDRPEKLYAEHKRIIDAIRAKDPDAAEAAARAHIKKSFQVHLQTLFDGRNPPRE